MPLIVAEPPACDVRQTPPLERLRRECEAVHRAALRVPGGISLLLRARISCALSPKLGIMRCTNLAQLQTFAAQNACQLAVAQTRVLAGELLGLLVATGIL